MPIALDPRREVKYVLRCDRALPPEKQTTFSIRPLTVRQAAEVKDSLLILDKATQDLKPASGSHELSILRCGLIGCDNFLDSSGKEVRFTMKSGVVSDEFLDRLAYDWRTELANAITDLSTHIETLQSKLKQASH